MAPPRSSDGAACRRGVQRSVALRVRRCTGRHLALSRTTPRRRPPADRKDPAAQVHRRRAPWKPSMPSSGPQRQHASSNPSPRHSGPGLQHSGRNVSPPGSDPRLQQSRRNPSPPGSGPRLHVAGVSPVGRDLHAPRPIRLAARGSSALAGVPLRPAGAQGSSRLDGTPLRPVRVGNCGDLRGALLSRRCRGPVLTGSIECLGARPASGRGRFSGCWRCAGVAVGRGRCGGWAIATPFLAGNAVGL